MEIRTEASFQLLDIAGKSIPPLSAILGALDQRPDRVEVCFPPDRLEWQGTPGAVCVRYQPDGPGEAI